MNRMKSKSDYIILIILLLVYTEIKIQWNDCYLSRKRNKTIV